ncbi:uncharacterized protein LOC124925916 [Impatiens glandulifera]|uniref:uncharacterized protein LOC124925916 n=1 Tax=Impatiens glandulifera TaxID=253017 RepID=UPI001FB09806|nr:uncharacterized protein LOC124925916 [Impatiens glandulifera]
MYREIVGVLLIVVFGWAYQIASPPPPKICGSNGGPPITATRLKLRDGRHLAYQEHGVPKINATHNIVFLHPFGSCRLDPNILTPEIAEELGVFLVSFDRPGYGESDPHPRRTMKSLALDVQELADHLKLGPKFYLVGFSMGGQAAWGCLKYIPHRLAGAALIAPVVNYWWPGFPNQLAKEAYYEQYPQDQWALRVAHYFPNWFTYWWNTQKWFPSSSVASGKGNYTTQDIQIIAGIMAASSGQTPRDMVTPTQQGRQESIFRDMMVGFGKWEFDPMELENSFDDGSVHLWQGDEDGLVPTKLQRKIAEKLPWIQYHEVRGAGHLLPFATGMREAIFNALLIKK